jgi:hypothetical protein
MPAHHAGTRLSPPFKAEDTSSVATLKSFCFMAETIWANIAESEIVEGETMDDKESGAMPSMYMRIVLQK